MNAKLFLCRLRCHTAVASPSARRRWRVCCCCCAASCFSLDYIIYCNILFPNRIFIHLRFYFFSFLAVPSAVCRRSIRFGNTFCEQSEDETTTTTKRKIHSIHKKCKRKRIERSAHTAYTRTRAHWMPFGAMYLSTYRVAPYTPTSNLLEQKTQIQLKSFSWKRAHSAK